MTAIGPPTARQDAFMDLLRPFQARLEAYLRSMTTDREEARDILQDTIVIAWQNFDTVRDRSAFRSYVYTIASNLIKRRHRRSRWFGVFTDEMHEHLAATTASPEQSTDAAIVRAAIQRLPLPSREALLLFEVDGLSVDEIARIQESSVSAVKVRLMRARRTVAQRLQSDTPTPAAASLPTPTVL